MSAAKRLFCLDLLRGLDIFLLTMLGPFVKYGWFKVFRPGEAADLFWKHSLTAFTGQGCAPTGWGIWDFGQPLFIFICGAAVPFAIPRRLDAQGHPTAAFWKHVLGRVAMLWLFGMLIRGALTFEFKGPGCWLYADTLQTIAVAYLAAALSQLIGRRWLRLAVALALIAALGAVMATCGDYSRLGNVSRLVDDRVFALVGARGKDFCYVLTTLAWAGMGILGSLAAEVLRGPLGAWRKAGVLAGWGTLSLSVGLVLGLWIPPIRYIYTVSFVFQSLGLAVWALAVLYVVTDIWQLRRGTGFFLFCGQSSLCLWMLSNFFGGAVDAVVARCTAGIPRLLGGTTYLPLVHQFGAAVVMAALAVLYRRAKTAGGGVVFELKKRSEGEMR